MSRDKLRGLSLAVSSVSLPPGVPFLGAGLRGAGLGGILESTEAARERSPDVGSCGGCRFGSSVTCQPYANDAHGHRLSAP